MIKIKIFPNTMFQQKIFTDVLYQILLIKNERKGLIIFGQIFGTPAIVYKVTCQVSELLVNCFFR